MWNCSWGKVSSPHTSYSEPGLVPFGFSTAFVKRMVKACQSPRTTDTWQNDLPRRKNGGCPSCGFTNTVPAITILSTAPEICRDLRKHCGHLGSTERHVRWQNVAAWHCHSRFNPVLPVFKYLYTIFKSVLSVSKFHTGPIFKASLSITISKRCDGLPWFGHLTSRTSVNPVFMLQVLPNHGN